MPQRFYVRQQSGAGDRHVYASRSRFLTEGVCLHFDARTWPPVPVDRPSHRAAEGVKVDLGAVTRAAWSRQAD
jgi:DNA helicase-2/ATP-dependent DNA helicase PcrA